MSFSHKNVFAHWHTSSFLAYLWIIHFPMKPDLLKSKVGVNLSNNSFFFYLLLLLLHYELKREKNQVKVKCQPIQMWAKLREISTIGRNNELFAFWRLKWTFFLNVSGLKFQKSLILALSLFGIHCITDNNTALLAHQNAVLFHSLAHSVLLFQHFFVVDLIYVSWRSKLHMEEQCCLLACFDHAKKTNEQPFSN